jgi:hypothetical protein
MLLAAAFFVSATLPAAAVPAFAVQTGQPCQTCHIGAFGPQLTPFGREFKLNGYTLRGTSDFTMPVSAMAVASFVHTAEDQPPPGTRVNLRVGLQYVAYTKFNGASSNFDGAGHNASDNNTLRIFLWTAF